LPDKMHHLRDNRKTHWRVAPKRLHARTMPAIRAVRHAVTEAVDHLAIDIDWIMPVGIATLLTRCPRVPGEKIDKR
jgi:hypothetical protein